MSLFYKRASGLCLKCMRARESFPNASERGLFVESVFSKRSSSFDFGYTGIV